MLGGADDDALVAGGGGEAAGGGGCAEAHCTSAPPTMANPATVPSRLNAPIAESILRDLIRKPAVTGGSAGPVPVTHGTPDMRIARAITVGEGVDHVAFARER